MAAVLSPFTLFSGNASLALVGLWLPVLFGVLLWQEGEVPVLLFVFMWQWLEVFTGVFYSVVRGTPMEALFGGPELSMAVWLSAAALVTAALGARLGLLGASVPTLNQLLSEARRLSIRAVWWAFVGAWVFAEIAIQLSAFSGQVRQIGLALSGVEVVAFFVLAYVVLARREAYRFLIAAVIIEVSTSIGAYFADFKQPLMVLFIVAVGVTVRVTLARAVLAAAIVAAAVLMGIVWSAIKLDYRDYVSGDTGAQIIVRPWSDRVGYLLDRVSDLDSYDLALGVEKLASRISYVKFLGYTIRRVPNYSPHENGRILGAAVRHIVTPRLFFPNKPALENDTAKTERYTGIYFHSTRQTSIGLGYITEAYIDFGRLGMFVPIFMLGLIWGLIFRFFMWRLPSIFGAAFAIPVLISTAQVGLGFNKLLGGMLMSFGVMALVAIYLLPRIQKRLYQAPVTGRTMTAMGIRK